MANVQYFLNRGRKIDDHSKPQMIYLRYLLGRDIDFKASIGFRVLIDNWDKEKQRVRNRSTVINRDDINRLISDLTTYFEKFESENRSKGITPTYNEARKHFDSFFTKPLVEKGLFDFIDEFITEAKTKNNPSTGKIVAEGTIRGYKSTQTILQDFSKHRYKLDFNKITLDWYYDFIDYCNTRKLSTNYTGKHIKTVNTFMTSAIEQGLTTNDGFKSKKFKVLKEESDNIYLTMDELHKIWSLDLSKDKKKETARNLFLIGAYTGLRVSDYNQLTEHNIYTVEGVKMLKVKAKKTGRVAAIPIHPIVDAILTMNGGKPPHRMPDQAINDNIKDVCEDAGIDGLEYIEKTKGGVKLIEKKYRFELVKTHTARRSFCTNAYLSGISTLDIMSISGHKTETAFMKYIKATPEQVAIKMSEHIFFRGATALKVV
jgi:integrase